MNFKNRMLYFDEVQQIWKWLWHNSEYNPDPRPGGAEAKHKKFSQDK
jgi:hypothetical protein